MRKNTLVVVSKMTELTNYSDELRSADTSNEKVFQELLNITSCTQNCQVVLLKNLVKYMLNQIL